MSRKSIITWSLFFAMFFGFLFGGNLLARPFDAAAPRIGLFIDVVSLLCGLALPLLILVCSGELSVPRHWRGR